MFVAPQGRLANRPTQHVWLVWKYVAGCEQWHTNSHKGGDACLSFIHQVHLEDGTAVMLVVWSQQRLQNNVIVGDAPSM